MERFGQVFQIRPEIVEEYKRLHANPWPEVLQMIKECNIRNYSIYLLDENTLFSYFEYSGDDYQADMAKMAADPKTLEWWAACNPYRKEDDTKSARLEEVFHMD